MNLVEEYNTVSKYTSKAVKITMTGSHMPAKVAVDEHYNNIAAMMQDLAKLMNRNFKNLETAGCDYIQIDEPLAAPHRIR
jgi:methionine synthase II (cobalamin-independent)